MLSISDSAESECERDANKKIRHTFLTRFVIKNHLLPEFELGGKMFYNSYLMPASLHIL